MSMITGMIMALILLFLLKGFLPVKGVSNITVDELKGELKNKRNQLVDVRSPMEFQRYHISGFKNIPLQSLVQQAKQLNAEQPVIVICQSGMRSQKSSKVLKKLGFKQILNVKGGVGAWR